MSESILDTFSAYFCTSHKGMRIDREVLVVLAKAAGLTGTKCDPNGADLAAKLLGVGLCLFGTALDFICSAIVMVAIPYYVRLDQNAPNYMVGCCVGMYYGGEATHRICSFALRVPCAVCRVPCATCCVPCALCVCFVCVLCVCMRVCFVCFVLCVLCVLCVMCDLYDLCFVSCVLCVMCALCALCVRFVCALCVLCVCALCVCALCVCALCVYAHARALVLCLYQHISTARACRCAHAFVSTRLFVCVS